MKNAEKYLKTSPLKLKFTPDWDPAGDEFSRAATAFKVMIMIMMATMMMVIVLMILKTNGILRGAINQPSHQVEEN